MNIPAVQADAVVQQIVETTSSSGLTSLFYPQVFNAVALAPFHSVAIRTALAGRASYWDILFLVPGFLEQADAHKVNNGEFPAVAAMSTGYIFRVENQATVAFLQRVGKTGHLVDIGVHKASKSAYHEPVVTVLYTCGILATAVVAILLVLINDTPALIFLGALATARLLNVIELKRRSPLGWKGAPENKPGDLLVLASQDRWLRIRGDTTDLKTVLSGQWLAEPGPADALLAGGAALLVFGGLAFAMKASARGSFLVAGLLVTNAVLLVLCNALATKLHMFGCVAAVTGDSGLYKRRLEMADQLLREAREANYPLEWAVKIGLVNELPGDGPAAANLVPRSPAISPLIIM
ncbi:hypothetical protein PsYK624_077340 [Phanerochaete sordida]|uniref:Uncharacterized protein n=1 Tax=Phanerochaete sordida TaxID=48140 RepID=A0A9P3LEG4_9APHY|nr:hypothetical protein PsYK624_077340 [Phanerochaete sordida]